MAAKGAHITQNIEVKPSLFEVLAADSLNTTFYPAIKRVVNFLATSKPAIFGGLVRYYDEFYTLFNGLVQGYYLNRYGGSLAEVFYGLTRVSARSKSFNVQERNWSFAVLVVLPYVLSKMEAMCNRWKEDYEAGKQISIERRLLFRMVPFVKAFYESVKLIHYVSYLSNATETHSPTLRILRLGLTYLSEEEESWSFKDIFQGKIRVATMLSTALLRWLELSAFFLQFIEWWQTEANIGDLSKLPIPDAPSLDTNASKYANVCPICLQKHIIPTAISVSGYVYCYRCIVNHLQKESRCPVTKYPATINDLIGIYTNDD
ncbi:peroxisome assembly protein 12-A [Anopheles ziemanni]|uniref:peroxisome assembly protein 12-A n=1 Tax=Anopheles coustani TaxID=139045 RepID=UPI002657DBF6|nr:peroxisome assembly protein 12-A [Anopheles coustani]XP_058172818.1 peroxisome assembly protein 12-A [Anopheles ziemanni]